MIMPLRWLPSFAMLASLALVLLTWTEVADARLDGGLSFAGGGVFRSINFDDIIAFDDTTGPGAAQPSYQGGSLGGLFNRPGLIGGFAAGFLGAGVVGLLFGHGVLGELNGVASVLGLAFQLALIAMLIRLIWIWWRDDKADAFAGLSPRQLADAYGHTRNEVLPQLDASTDGEATQDEPADDGLGHPK